MHPFSTHRRLPGRRQRTRKTPTTLQALTALALLLSGAAPAAASAQAGRDTLHQASAAHAHGHPKGMGHEHGPAVVALPADPDGAPPLYVGMGDHTMGRVSRVREAQAYFDQAVILAYAFNHPEAAVNFAHAAALDPSCALCAWGEALVLGPNINASMDPSMNARAHAAAQEALSRLDAASSERERALVRAVVARYAPEPAADRAALDRAYAEAMREVAARHPSDPDVQALFADALMTTMPWDYWRVDGSAKPATVEVRDALERALDADLRHPLANHLWIHLWEKHQPEKALPAAERLEGLAPAAGHLVHMPGHIYIRVGRYADAVLANQRAIVADQAYLAQSGTEGIYRIGYVPHNVHFLWAAATLAGRSATALDAADRLAAGVDPAHLTTPGMSHIVQDFWVTPLLARVRFGKWDEILAWPEMDGALLYPRGIRHYARAVALARKGRIDEARQEAAAVERIADDPALAGFTLWETNEASTVLRIAAGVARGEVAGAAGDVDAAVAALREAVELEDGLIYQEPEMWHHPVRQILGDVLLGAGRLEEAEATFRADLRKYPENGWSLRGLALTLEGRGRTDEAAEAWERYRAAFRDADVAPERSRF